MDEFALIRRYFSRDSQSGGVAVGVGDDGAVLVPSPGMQQVQVIDTLVEGVHYPADMAAADVGFRAVAVNLSDMAAMGARPRWMTLALTLSGKDEAWVQGFARGLYAAADAHDVALVGGDTTSGNVVVSVHMTGEVEVGGALLRSGARAGDEVFVSGTLGDAAAGLDLVRTGEPDHPLAQRFLRPNARVGLGLQLAGIAHAAIDLSDGLVGDLRKLAEASGVGLDIDVARLPLSDELRATRGLEDGLRLALSGGDDYELAFTARAGDVAGIEGITSIGVVSDGAGITCLRGGKVVEVDDRGYRHFA